MCLPSFGAVICLKVSGDYGHIGGGLSNTVLETGSSVAAGGLNTASGEWSSVGGGNSNSVGDRSVRNSHVKCPCSVCVHPRERHADEISSYQLRYNQRWLPESRHGLVR